MVHSGASRPVLVSDVRKVWAIAAVSLWAVSAVGIVVVSDLNLPFVNPGGHLFSPASPILFAVTLAVLTTYVALKSKRVAFYDDHLEIKGLFGRRTDLRYSEIDLNPPLINERTGHSSSFGIRKTPTNGEPSSDWTIIANHKVAETKDSLFDWLARKII